MNVLVIGSGGREHALCDALKKSNKVRKIFAIPGNPGIASIATCVDINPLDNDDLRVFCEEFDIKIVIPGSEVFLENGITDFLTTDERLVFGPSKEAAQIESSKEFAKELMKKYDIPTAYFKTFNDYNKAKEYVDKKKAPLVIKYDGLAGGKGVVVALTDDEAYDALDLMLNKRVYGNANIIIEEYLEGPEFSLMCFVHNETVYPMPIAQDHKRLLDGDFGPNTGGMGIYSGVPMIPTWVVDDAMRNVMIPVANALCKEGSPFTGFLYGGLMYTKEGPKVIEFNARFGDPEAEVILPKLKSDIIDVIHSVCKGEAFEIEWDDQYYVGVVMASKGYPSQYEKGVRIEGENQISDIVYHMGTKRENGKLLTNGGRVLLITGKGDTLVEAQKKAYANVSKIKCDNLIYRKDIAMKSLKR